jgi:hypothetical protein
MTNFSKDIMRGFFAQLKSCKKNQNFEKNPDLTPFFSPKNKTRK